MSIEDKIADWLKSDASMEARGTALYDDVVAEAKRLRALLYDSLPASLKPMGVEVFQIGQPRFHDGVFDVEITVDPAMVHRDSMDPGRYPRGVENIIENFNVGWETRLTDSGLTHRKVRGMWHGGVRWSRPVYPGVGRTSDQDPVHFLEKAIDEFISTSQFEPRVVLNNQYTTRRTY